jgi:hypothetical protein
VLLRVGEGNSVIIIDDNEEESEEKHYFITKCKKFASICHFFSDWSSTSYGGINSSLAKLAGMEVPQIVFTTSGGIWGVNFVLPKTTHVIVVDVIKSHDEAL